MLYLSEFVTKRWEEKEWKGVKVVKYKGGSLHG